MGKEVVLYDKITVDGTEISMYCRGVESESTNEQIDDSGFSATGNDEFLAGKRTQSVTLDIMAGSEVMDLLEGLHTSRDVFPFIWQPHGLVDSARRKLTGNAQLLTYSPGGSRGEVRSMSAQFTAGDSDGFDWVDGAS